MPVTVPAALIVATDGVPLIHVPPVAASASVVVEPIYVEVVPVIAEGAATAVTA